jgi:hypothetical protein
MFCRNCDGHGPIRRLLQLSLPLERPLRSRLRCPAMLISAHPTENPTSTSVEIIAIPNHAPNALTNLQITPASAQTLRQNQRYSCKNYRYGSSDTAPTRKSVPVRNRCWQNPENGRQGNELDISRSETDCRDGLAGNVESASHNETDALATTAKRHRVDVVKVSTAVEAEVSAKQAKSAAKQKKVATTVVAKSIPAAYHRASGYKFALTCCFGPAIC